MESNRILVVDTDARITRQYARWYHDGYVDARLDGLAEECKTRYHLTVLCGDDIPYVDDGTRAGLLRRKDAQIEIREELRRGSPDWIEATGTVEERIRQVSEAIRSRGLLNWR